MKLIAGLGICKTFKFKCAPLVLTLSILCGFHINLFPQNPEVIMVSYSGTGIDSLLTISVPDYLIPVPDLNQEAILQFANYFNETYTMVIKETAKDGQMNLESTVQYFLDEIVKRGGEPGYISRECIKGKHAFQAEIEMEVDGTKIWYVATFIDCEEVVYKIFSWTLAERRNNYRFDFAQLAQSFSLNTAFYGKEN